MVIYVGVNKMTMVISIFGVAIALIEVGFIIFKYSKETTRKKDAKQLKSTTKYLMIHIVCLMNLKKQQKRHCLIQKILEIIQIYTNQL